MKQTQRVNFRTHDRKSEPNSLAKFVGIGALALGWCVLVFAAAVFLSKDSYGENTGKFIGTLFSGVAFFPAVRVFMNWYRRTEGDATTRRPSPESLRSAAQNGSDEPQQSKLDE